MCSRGGEGRRWEGGERDAAATSAELCPDCDPVRKLVLDRAGR